MRIFWRLALKRRRTATIEWLRVLPNAGPLPQEKHTFAIVEGRIAASWGAGLVAGQLAAQGGHREDGAGGVGALVALAAAGPGEGLVEVADREHAEGAGHAGV